MAGEVEARLEAGDAAPEQGRVLSIHLGESANCSSVGSVIDILFVSTVAASAVLAAVVVLLEKKADDVAKKKSDAGPR